MLKRSDAVRPVCHLNLVTSTYIMTFETPDLVLLYQMHAYVFLCRHTGPKVFQLYVWKDRGLVQDVIKKAKAGGFNALALTADFTWYGNRERDIRNGKSCKMHITETHKHHAHTRIHVYMYIYICTFMYIYIHIYIYVHIQDVLHITCNTSVIYTIQSHYNFELRICMRI